MLIFRRISKLYNASKASLESLGDAPMNAKEVKQFSLLKEIVAYVNKAEWLTHEKTREKLRLFLRHRFDYQVLVQEHSLTVAQAHKCISYCSAQLSNKLGVTLDLIESGQIDSAYREFCMQTGNHGDQSRIFYGDLIRRYPPSESRGMDLRSCEREIELLEFLSSQGMKRLFLSYDATKLGHLLYVLLSGDKRYVRERGLLVRCIVEGSLPIEDVLRQFESFNAYTDLSQDYFNQNGANNQ